MFENFLLPFYLWMPWDWCPKRAHQLFRVQSTTSPFRLRCLGACLVKFIEQYRVIADRNCYLAAGNLDESRVARFEGMDKAVRCIAMGYEEAKNGEREIRGCGFWRRRLSPKAIKWTSLWSVNSCGYTRKWGDQITTLSVVIWFSTGTLGIFATLVYALTVRVVIYDILSMVIIPTLSTSILFCNLSYILLWISPRSVVKITIRI